MKQHAPATLRNREPIADVLAEHLPAGGTVLEIASGTGEHVVFLAERFAHLTWQPSDYAAAALPSIASWREDAGLANVLAPIQLDASADDWPIVRADAIWCCNMVHISPLSASEGLVRGSARLLAPGAPLILYGPWREEGVPLAPSNCEFDASLKARDPHWGLRQLEWFDDMAAALGFARTARVAMPANNLLLVYRKPE